MSKEVFRKLGETVSNEIRFQIKKANLKIDALLVLRDYNKLIKIIRQKNILNISAVDMFVKDPKIQTIAKNFVEIKDDKQRAAEIERIASSLSLAQIAAVMTIQKDMLLEQHKNFPKKLGK